MLIFILIDVQYLDNDVFSFEKGLIHQNHSLNSHNPIKNPPSKIPLSLSLLSIWKNLIHLGSLLFLLYMLIMICLKLTNSLFISTQCQKKKELR